MRRPSDRPSNVTETRSAIRRAMAGTLSLRNAQAHRPLEQQVAHLAAVTVVPEADRASGNLDEEMPGAHQLDAGVDAIGEGVETVYPGVADTEAEIRVQKPALAATEVVGVASDA